jgi:hypothetical protein
MTTRRLRSPCTGQGEDAVTPGWSPRDARRTPRDGQGACMTKTRSGEQGGPPVGRVSAGVENDRDKPDPRTDVCVYVSNLTPDRLHIGEVQGYALCLPPLATTYPLNARQYTDLKHRGLRFAGPCIAALSSDVGRRNSTSRAAESPWSRASCWCLSPCPSLGQLRRAYTGLNCPRGESSCGDGPRGDRACGRAGG